MNDRIQTSRRALALLLLFASGLHADTLVLKNGQTISGRSFLRQGDVILVSVGPDGKPPAPGKGTPVAEIESVECDPPAVLKTAPAMLAAGKGSAVLVGVETALKASETFGLLPGSYWPELSVMQAQILAATGKDEDSIKLAIAMEKTMNPDLVRDSQALRALISARKGDRYEAESMLEKAGKDLKKPATRAAAAVTQGLLELEKKQFEEALKFFLELPVFLPNETAFSGIAQLGSAQAYYGMEDFDRSIAALEALVKTRPDTPEISLAQSLLPEWQRRRTVVLEAKEP